MATRLRAPREDLLRFVRAPDGTVAFDVAAAMPTRGAWTAPSQEAITLAVERGGLARAFGKPVLVELPKLLGEVERVLSGEILQALGLLRRQSGLIVGRSECLEHASAGRGGRWLLAADLAARSRDELGVHAEGALVGPSMEAVGQALGRAPVGVLLVTATGPLRRRLVTDIQRWGRLNGHHAPLSDAPATPAPSMAAPEVSA